MLIYWRSSVTISWKLKTTILIVFDDPHELLKLQKPNLKDETSFSAFKNL